MTAELSVGILSPYSAASNLSVHSHSRVKLAPSGKDDIDQLQLRLTAYKEGQDRADIPFILLDGDFEVAISVRLEGTFDEQAHDAAVANLPLTLGSMKLWSELCLASTAVRVARDALGDINIVLSVEPSDEAPRQKGRSLHRIDNDVPFTDFRPPEGVPTAILTSVQIDVVANAMDGKSFPPVCGHSSCSHEEIIDGPESVSGLDDMLGDALSGHQDYSPLATDDDKECNPIPSRLGESMLSWVSEQEKEINGGLSPLLSDADFSDYITDATPDCGFHFLKLIESAIEAVFTQKPRMWNAYSTMADERFTTLAAIAPGIFQHKYLSSIAARSVFLPTVSNAIAKISCSRPGQKHRSDALRRCSLCASSNAIHDSKATVQHDMSRLRDALQARLWKLLERHAFSLQDSAVQLQRYQAPTRTDELKQDVTSGLCDTHLANQDLANISGLDKDDAMSDIDTRSEEGWSDDELLDDLGCGGNVDSAADYDRSYSYSSASQLSSSSDSAQSVSTTNTGTTSINSQYYECYTNFDGCTDGGSAMEPDMLSLCSSVDMLSLPDSGSGELIDGYEEKEQPEACHLLPI